MKNFLLVSTLLLSTTLAFSQTLLHKIEPQNDYDIAYEVWQLDNGLTIIVHEDNSDPMVHVEVTYHVGSNREQIGMTGFAHFFEHMMFQGSENVGDDEHFKIISGKNGFLDFSNDTQMRFFDVSGKSEVNQLSPVNNLFIAQ